MEGIIILEEIQQPSDTNYVVLCSCLMIAMVAGLWGIIISEIKRRKGVKVLMGLAIFVVGFCTIIAIYTIGTAVYSLKLPRPIQYHVQVSETTPFVEFDDRYEIIERLPDHEFIVRERE